MEISIRTISVTIVTWIIAFCVTINNKAVFGSWCIWLILMLIVSMRSDDDMFKIYLILIINTLIITCLPFTVLRMFMFTLGCVYVSRLITSYSKHEVQNILIALIAQLVVLVVIEVSA